MTALSPRTTRSGQPSRSTPARRRRWWAEVGWKYPVALVIVFYAAFPLVYALSAALDERGSLAGSGSLFRTISFANFEALGDTMFWTWVGNTLLVGGSAALGAVVMGAAAAYAFSRFRFRGRRASLTALLIIQMFPQTVAFVAVFLLLITLGEAVPALGINSKLALICVYLGGALGANTFLMYGFFNSVPKELDEAAKIDGAGHARVFFTIILRLAAPILAVVGLLSFVATFSDYIIAGIVLQSQDRLTVAVGLYQFISGQFDARWGIFAAGAVISAIPVLLLFLFLQRYIVGGLTSGSVKG